MSTKEQIVQNLVCAYMNGAFADSKDFEYFINDIVDILEDSLNLEHALSEFLDMSAEMLEDSQDEQS